MPTIFKPFQSKLPNKDGEYLFHPRLVKTGVVTTLEVAKQIAWATALTEGDVFNVLRALPVVMRQSLNSSYSVKLDGMGTFTLVAKANGTGVKTEKEVSSAQFTFLRCQFTPEYTRNPGGGTTRALTEGIKFVKLSSITGDKLSDIDNDNDDDDNGGIDPGV